MRKYKVKVFVGKVKSAIEEPYKSWRLELDCGHGAILTAKRRPTRKTLACSICSWDDMTEFWEKEKQEQLSAIQQGNQHA